jgi:hypothetical protein
MASHPSQLRSRLARHGIHPIVVASLLSFVGHGLGAATLSQLNWSPTPPPPPPDKVLEVAFVSQGDEPGELEAVPEPPEPEPPTPPTEATDAVAEVAEVAPQPQPVVQPPSPKPPDVRFPALQAAADRPNRPTPSVHAPQTDFATWQRQRMAHVLPDHVPDPLAGGAIDGTASIDTQGTDRCEPAENRSIGRLYLLFDSSGSMSSQRRAQALSCAQQYAQAAIDRGADVVVGNFANGSSFSEPTRDPTEVAFAIRADTDPRRTVLPSRELNPFFDDQPNATADLVILSDGEIENLRSVLPWYRYFLEMTPGNRGYLYTLGFPARPEPAAMLREIGFEIYVYRVL